MNIEQIKTLANRAPFRPFVIQLENGEMISVTSDTELFFPRKRPNEIHVFANDGIGWIFEAQAVSALQQ